MERTWPNNDDMINDVKDIDFFNKITELYIRGNFKFDILPDSLTFLDCVGNELSGLPPLPDSLTWLDCAGNELSSLPTLPYTLRCLDCSNNQLSSLPTLPKTLIGLFCNNNQLSNLPTLPNTLTKLICNINPYNLWSDLIDATQINIDFAEIICEKLSLFNDRIQEIHNELNQNINNKYNEKMEQLKKDIQEVLNAKCEIIL
jgi:Leucine-rich repeat (LRR) protein